MKTTTMKMMLINLLALALCVPAFAAVQLDPLIEYRYSGPPKRNAKGNIIRRADVQRAFRKVHPCPSTGLTAGPCPGWEKDHVIPLASCGADAVWNMQWLPVAIKRTAGTLPKDRWERRDYTCAHGGY